MNWADKFRNITQLGGATLLATAMTMLEGVIAARVLGPAVLGAWFTFQIVLRYGGRLHFGVPNAFRRQLSVDRGAKNESQIGELADVVATFLVVVIIVQVAIVGGMAIWPGFSSEIRVIALFGIVIIASQTAKSFVHPFNNGLGNFEENALLKLVGAASSVVTIGLTIQFSLVGFLFGRVLREVAQFGIGFYRIGYIPSFSLDTGRLRRLLRIGFLIMLVSFSSQVFKTVDRLMIIWYFPSKSLGFYGTGDTFATLLLTVSSVVTNVLYTSFSEKYGADLSSEQFKSELLGTVKVISYFFPIVFVNIYVFVPLVIQIVLPEYPASVPVARALAFGYIFFAGATVVGSVLNSFKKQRLYILVIAIGITVNAALNYAAIQLGGELIGIGIATAGTYFVFFLLLFGVVIAFFDGSVRLFGRVTVQLLVPALFALGYALLVSDYVAVRDSAISLDTVWTAVVLFAAVMPLSVSFGVLTLREADINLSQVHGKVTQWAS
ncbi:oligosaccharide flippase family protein [Halorarum halophilum]|uniref:Oligosaccharide flippase family protein n=1 Tax=Halorarum halophilum TaxID=2743090 RepID=A0A7D5K912_9EURY|nr:oligosaccharide flippase family protein [Halobaculum halophilum]QLG28679.1 oligosaccharide flippase family protein [Halobaculum halophilum]